MAIPIAIIDEGILQEIYGLDDINGGTGLG